MFGPKESIDEEQPDPCSCVFDGLIIDEAMTSLEGLRALQDHTKFVPLYFSSPIDYGTPSQGVDFRSLTWFVAKEDASDYEDEAEGTINFILGYRSSIFGYMPDEEYPITAKFMCSECSDDSDCQNQGICNEDGQCQCQILYK